MIPILYEYNATDFLNYGIGALRDTIECLVSEERNGAYELVLKYPAEGFLYEEIKKERIIKAMANVKSAYQAFRIYRISRPMSGVITVYAQHISYDLAYIISPPVYFSGHYLVTAFSYFFNFAVPPMSAFTFESETPNVRVFLETDLPRNVRSLLIGKELSIVEYLRGDFEFDNFVVRYHSSRGEDNGLTILYGKNLTQIQHNSDNSNIYSLLCPYAVVKVDGNTRTLTLSEAAIEIPTSLNVKKCLVMDFSEEFERDGAFTPNEENLRFIAERYLYQNFLGVESPNITLSFEELGEINAAKNINLCDTVTVKYEDLGIDVKTNIVKLVFDSLLEKIKSISLGEIKQNLADDVTSINKDIKKLAERVKALEIK